MKIVITIDSLNLKILYFTWNKST